MAFLSSYLGQPQSFIKHKPFGMHKLIHRIKGGDSQICVQPFDQRSYRAFRLRNPTSPLSEEDTMAILEELMNRMRVTNLTYQETRAENVGLLSRAEIKINHFLDDDSKDLLEDQLSDLSPKQIKKIKDKLREVPRDKLQIVFDIAFSIILGYAGNSSYILKHEMLSTIESIYHALTNIPAAQFADVYAIADTIFGSTYLDVDSDHFQLEDRLSLFHSFLNSTHGHLLDKQNRGDLVYVYHMPYDSLRTMAIEPEEIQDPVYLASFVEAFRNLADDDLRDLCNTISVIYTSKDYEFRGYDCENWELLAEQLRTLDPVKRKTLSNFVSCLPNTFDMGPADAIEIFKDTSWLDKINKLKNFEKVSELAKQTFEIYDDQEEQLEALDIILTGLINNQPTKKGTLN